MAAGWLDYLHKLLGRIASFNPAAGPPYRVAAEQTFCSGMTAGTTFHTGIVAGEVDGRAN